jgi:hypothetical protein
LVPDEAGNYNRVEWPAEYQLPVAGIDSGLWKRGQAQMWDKNSDTAPIDWPFVEGSNSPAVFYDPREYQERFGVVEFCQENAQYCSRSGD